MDRARRKRREDNKDEATKCVLGYGLTTLIATATNGHLSRRPLIDLQPCLSRPPRCLPLSRFDSYRLERGEELDSVARSGHCCPPEI
ncbi:hypothetical protein OBBRIDRAFT_228689 [Obba rivulosa]|uniref:Uncharacterized protein n=1 Tax=Obba rivulosa TaxID=1052685 RepID=A0A8E2DV59_9APHY|nr:hypothetical protein OBBRIDRAFT_228689 [Obba rivulosa]